MAGINKVIIVGNLGIDPEVRTLESGAKLARLRIATSESYTNKEGQRIDQTEWHNVVVWRQLADVAEKFLVKGKQVYIEGKLRTRQWKDNDGNDRYTTEIVGDVLQLLGRAGDQTSEERPQPANTGVAHSHASSSDESDSDDLPF
jgi:single-strand DNA-binding protein